MTKKLLQHALLGPRAAVDLVTPTGLDAATIWEFEVLRETMTAGELLQTTAALIGGVNQDIANMYGGIMTITDEMYGITRQGEGSRTMTPLKVEFTDSDAVRSDEIGHMLPLTPYEDAVGWDEEYLLNGSRRQVQFDLQLITERWRNRFDYEFVTRILTDTENAIGSSGYDVGWAIGTGTNVNYIPPQWRGHIFSSSHTHYLYKDSDSDTYADLLNSMVQQLRHHGFGGRLVCLVSEDDLASYTALSGYAEWIPPEIRLGVTTTADTPKWVYDGMFEGVPGELFGFFKSTRGMVELRYHERIPTGYAWMTKSFGNLSPQNGVAIRRHPSVPFGLRPDAQLTKSINPSLEYVRFLGRFGVGVNDRLNGVAGYIASAATEWVDATIT